MINFADVKIIKNLGAGMFGTTYLVEYKNKEYAMKIQHILPKDRKKDFKNELWRELDLYEYINTLSKKDQAFFTKLYQYEIYNNCDHIQKRPFKVNEDNKVFAKKLKKLDESDWCVRYLLQYKGDMTLYNFLNKNKLSQKQIYSFMLQICKMIYLLKLAGYSHNDLHSSNIMINKTNEKTFTFYGHKIPYEGYQLSAIDYGEVLNEKYGIKHKGYLKNFTTNKELWSFNEYFFDTFPIVDNLTKYMNDCEKQKKLLPWEKPGNVYDKATKKYLINHQDFIDEIKDKYIKQFPRGKLLLEKVIKHKNDKKEIRDMVKNNNDELYFWQLLERIITEFILFNPDKYQEYWEWCSQHEMNLPKDIIIKLLQINNSDDYIKFLISQLKKLG